MERERSLIIIPIAHTYAEMGSLKEQVPYNEEYDAVVTQYWVQVFTYLKSLPAGFSGLKVYQDGLVDTKAEIVEKIVEETQTANYEILRWLKEQGALIIGTENPNLLIEEHQSLQAIFDSSGETSKEAARLEYLKKSFWLLEARDSYIAQRIRRTLREGETGLLFIGAAHNVKGFLGEEIKMSEPEILKVLLPQVLREFWGVN